MKIKTKIVGFVGQSKVNVQTELLCSRNLLEFRIGEMEMKKSSEDDILMSDKPKRKTLISLTDKLFKLSSYFILTSVFSLFKKFEKKGSTDEISQIHLSLGELNNKYVEINPEQDEFSQISINDS